MDLEKYLKNNKTSYLAESYKKLLQNEEETKKMIEGDPTLADLAHSELEEVRVQKETLWKQMEEILKEEETEEEFPNEVILEVRAGAGGEEASLFAEILANMYKKYAERKGWAFLEIDISKSDLGGFKDASFEIRGKDVYK